MTVQTVSKRQAPAAKRKSLLTGEELLAMGDMGRAELVKGELIRISPTGFLHGIIESNFGKKISAFVDQHQLGVVVVGEVGIYTRRNPDTVRGADAAFISNERLAQRKSSGYLDVAPELIVEVLSPGDSWSEMNEKLEEYFAIGVQQVWVADPRRRQIPVYHSPTRLEHLSDSDTLTSGDVLPGFSAPVAEMFGEM